MALSDLTLKAIEHYGGIDLKRNYKKYFGGGLSLSIGLHLLVFLLYIGYSWLTTEEEMRRPTYALTDISFLPPPRSVTEDIKQPVPISAPTPGAQIKPHFGVPVPIPTAIDVENVLPEDMIFSVGDPTSGLPAVESHAPVTLDIPREKPAALLDKTIFVDFSEAPKPIIDIQKLVVYPEFAKRTGIEGAVTISALIGIDGRVKAVDIEHSTNQWLDVAAREAMMKARFTPALQGDEPVEVWYTQKIQFKLNAGK